MNSDSTNAVAGPSNHKTSHPPPSSLSPTPHLFLPPPGPPHTHPPHLSSTQDLLARFCLLPAYDKYVRPFAAPGETDLDHAGPMPPTPITNGILDKGKGKEVNTPGSVGVADGGDDDDEGAGGKGEKKKKNNYKHLIKGIPGKHSLKKDDYLSTMIQVPPKPRIQIAPFDIKTQREAFTMSLEGLKGWNPNALVLESAQAREDRKKRKEFKRLAKLQQAQAHLLPPATHPQPIQAPIPTSASPSSLNRGSPALAPGHSGTPRPGSTIPGSAGSTVQRPGSTVPRPGSTIPNQGATSVSRPGSTIPRPGSTVPRPGSTKPILTPGQVPGRVGTPSRAGATSYGGVVTAAPTSAAQNPYGYSVDQDKRGKKRERDEAINGASNVNGSGGLGNNNLIQSKVVVNAKAGLPGARPRPIKKQRMDIQGQARDVTVTQQPTPQGV